ncbi:MAG: hypothetical protein ACJAVZ_000695 [Afipia broomeae]|jgi:Protein of unknown function (DUF2840)|uniref:Glycosidase n=1 Tax=Mesorhizobium hungaricum TaxID=1566387 RepID=A0A1C2DMZ2_9HYPH|nr:MULTISPECIES: DUF2840 domain-containing protein [Mesorhizobium]MBN9237003.1 DUF2840 domain-containing protein [Mesorhizobium sp.]OCX16130.1 glycosidase [Mesorhizobium hungaricum]
MIAAADSPATRRPCSADAASDPLTHVELTWIEKRQEDWIRFGRQAREQILDRRRRVVSFQPESQFALVRWAANDFGTFLSNIAIARAVWRGEAFQTLPSVRPGADILLSVDGWPKVERVLQAIDAVEDRGIDPADAAPDYWRHVHNRLAAGLEPRTYTAARHRAFRLRRSIAP